MSAKQASERERTHWDECWRDPAHHACAVGRVERLLVELEDQKQHAKEWEEAAEFYKNKLKELGETIRRKVKAWEVWGQEMEKK